MATKWTSDQEKWFADNYPQLGIRQTIDAMRELFGIERTEGAITTKAKRMKIHVDADIHYKHKCEHNKTYRAKVGDVRKRHKGNGYTQLDICIGANKWMPYSRHLWETNFGKLPKGYEITFIDGNQDNIELDNMVALDRSVLMKRVGHKWSALGEEWLDLLALEQCDIESRLDNGNPIYWGKNGGKPY